MFCGYCGSPIGSDSGTSQSGKIVRYYRCSGKRKKICNSDPVRKERIEQVVIDALQEAFNKTDLDWLADRILEQNEKVTRDTSVMNLLTAEYNETEKALNHLLNAMEQGIFTNSTKDRLEHLEQKKAELEMKIAIEQAREKKALTKFQILKYLQSAVKLQPKFMIDFLIDKVVLFDDRIDIYCKYTDDTNPDGPDNHRDFPFYSLEITLDIDRHTFGGTLEKVVYNVSIYI